MLVQSDMKLVMVVDGDLPSGVIANTCAILGMSLGKLFPETVGPDVVDAASRTHAGIVSLPIPILKGSARALEELRERLFDPELASLTVVDFTDVARRSGHYDEYTEAMAGAAHATPLGIAICGGRRAVTTLTGSLPLLR